MRRFWNNQFWEKRPRLWHRFLLIISAIFVIEMAWYAASPTKASGWLFVAAILIIGVIAYEIIRVLFRPKWKGVW